MEFFQSDGRIDDLKIVLSRTVSIATLFDDDGISIRFMNDSSVVDPRELDGIRTEQQVESIISRKKLFGGNTPMGEMLREKIIGPLIAKAASGQLNKPLLVITITDGHPTDAAEHNVQTVIKTASSHLNTLKDYGSGVLSLQFAQVGADKSAMEFLASLDNDPQVGHLVDCTSSRFRSRSQYDMSANIACV